MADLLELESAITDAEGAAAVLTVLENDLTSDMRDGWRALRLEPRDDLCVTALSPTERRALDHASYNLQQAVAKVSRVYYALVKARAL